MSEDTQYPPGPVAHPVETDDVEFQLPSGRRAWGIALSVMALAGVLGGALAGLGVPKVAVAGIVMVASFTGPFIAGSRGHISMDRAVPFAGVVGVMAVIFCNICLGIGSQGDFYPGRGNPTGPLLYLMAFAGVPTFSVLGGVLGCVVDRRGRVEEIEDDAHLLL